MTIQSPRPSLTIFIVTSAALLAIVFCGHRLSTAHDRLERASLALIALESDAAELARLRSRTERIAWRKRPEQDVLARVNATLAEAGLSPSHLSDLREESDSTIGAPSREGAATPNWRRQSIRLTLADTTTAELGAFLQRWLETQPLWTPSRIELAKSQSPANTTGGAHDRFVITLTLTATYVFND